MVIVIIRPVERHRRLLENVGAEWLKIIFHPADETLPRMAKVLVIRDVQREDLTMLELSGVEYAEDPNLAKSIDGEDHFFQPFTNYN